MTDEIRVIATRRLKEKVAELLAMSESEWDDVRAFFPDLCERLLLAIESFKQRHSAHVLGAGREDDEPVTPDWLIATGWKAASHRGKQDRWELTLMVQHHGPGLGSTRHWLVIHEPHGEWWPIDFRQMHDEDKKEDGVALITWIERTTRGHIRQIISALWHHAPLVPTLPTPPKGES